MDKPKDWSPEWQSALINANLEIPCFRSGISSYEFAKLAGVNVTTVNKFAKEGLEAFKKRFGEHCRFEDVGGREMPFKRIYTFAGSIQPSIYNPPCPNVITSSEFAIIHGLQSGGPHVGRFARKGHAWFQRRFPGWDFLEIKTKTLPHPIRWYGLVADVGEQIDEALPEDNLTVTQFAFLKGVSEEGVRLTVGRGLAKFQHQYPGWSFCVAYQKPIFYRSGPEIETLTVRQFAQRMGYSISFINKLVEQARLSKTFPDWQIRLTGLKTPKWFIYRLKEETDLPLEGAMPLQSFAEVARVSHQFLRDRIADHTLNDFYPEWNVQRDKRSEWQIYPVVKDVPLPPRNFIEMHNLVTVRQFAELFGINDSTADGWFRHPHLLAEHAPGWSSIQMKFPFNYCKNWLKPPQ